MNAIGCCNNFNKTVLLSSATDIYFARPKVVPNELISINFVKKNHGETNPIGNK